PQLIQKTDILLISSIEKASQKQKLYKQAYQAEFECAELKEKRKIPIAQIRELLKHFFIFPIQLFFLLRKSSTSNIFFFFLTQFYYWFVFFSYYRVKNLILSCPSEADYQTIICNFFGCSTIAYHTSYLGGFDNFKNRNIHVNHLLLWGECQVYAPQRMTSVDNVYFTGCHFMTTVEKGQRAQKNIVFFDNKIINDASTTEDSLIQFTELMLRISEIFDVSVFYRPKESEPFDLNHFRDKKKYFEIKRKFEKASIVILAIEKYDTGSVLSRADIVVSNMVGTPSMLAHMLGIPSFSYYQKIEESPDPIMKNYLNEFIFEDQDKLIEKIAQVLAGKESPQLRVEEKKKINHYLDSQGLYRLRSRIAAIVNTQSHDLPT
ncbi:MAG: hypothetical protein HYS98_05115, partial [Deltaproteobacteria bacterium]|nr:hypothetical protein [Deltaproteobacteria bacterium]